MVLQLLIEKQERRTDRLGLFCYKTLELFAKARGLRQGLQSGCDDQISETQGSKSLLAINDVIKVIPRLMAKPALGHRNKEPEKLPSSVVVFGEFFNSLQESFKPLVAFRVTWPPPRIGTLIYGNPKLSPLARQELG